MIPSLGALVPNKSLQVAGQTLRSSGVSERLGSERGQRVGIMRQTPTRRLGPFNGFQVGAL